MSERERNVLSEMKFERMETGRDTRCKSKKYKHEESDDEDDNELYVCAAAQNICIERHREEGTRKTTTTTALFVCSCILDDGERKKEKGTQILPLLSYDVVYAYASFQHQIKRW